MIKHVPGFDSSAPTTANAQKRLPPKTYLSRSGQIQLPTNDNSLGIEGLN